MDEVDKVIENAHKAAERHPLRTVHENVHKYLSDHECCYVLVIAREDENEAISRSEVKRSCGDIVMALASVSQLLAEDLIDMEEMKRLVRDGLRKKMAMRLLDALLDQAKGHEGDNHEDDDEGVQ